MVVSLCLNHATHCTVMHLWRPLLRRFHVASSVAGFLCVVAAVVLTFVIVPTSVRPRCPPKQHQPDRSTCGKHNSSVCCLCDVGRIVDDIYSAAAVLASPPSPSTFVSTDRQ